MNHTVINIFQSSPLYSFEHAIQQSLFPLSCLMISFELVLLSTLNHVKLNETELFSVNFDKFKSLVKAVVSKDFDYQQMGYNSKIDVLHSQQHKIQTYIDIDHLKYNQTNSQKIVIMLSFDKKQLFENSEKNIIKFIFGNTNEQKGKTGFQARYSINNFQFYYKKNPNLRTDIQINNMLSLLSVNSLTLYNYNIQQGSFPILYLIQKQNLKSQGQKYFQQLIRNTQNYAAINITKKNNFLFMCHDMKGGYKEDTIFSSPILKSRTNSYRYNFFWQTSIFNYFSHKTISIPPKHWRQQCRRYKVKCLGTFIVQPFKIFQDYYLTRQFGLKLVYIAKKYKFDGYLLNIQDSVKNITKFKSWLQMFVSQMHQQIPGSMISWYDSITESGNIEYQNQVNKKNKVFYEMVDSFYTNYWWNDEKLKQQISQAEPNKTIYIGNDVYGRGTYGGGQFNLFKAIDKIQSLNNTLFGSAIFAPGYTYQKGGNNNNPYFQANQDKLYRGVLFDKYDITQWSQLKVDKAQFPTIKEQQNLQKWFNSFFPMNLWLYKNKMKLKIDFLYVLNTQMKQKNTAFDYKIKIKIRDTLTNKTITSEVKEEFNVLPPTLSSVKKVSVYLDTEDMSPKTDIEIFKKTTAKDAIVKQMILISYYEKQGDWISKTPLTKISFNQQYNSFFNIGHGQSFYVYGKPINMRYDFMADYDMPHTRSINHPFSTQINHEDSYMGGSCLKITNSTAKLFTFQLPPTQYAYAFQYYIKIVTKGEKNITLSFRQSNGFSVELSPGKQQQLANGWVKSIFYLQKKNFLKIKKSFYPTFQTTLEISFQGQQCLIGQIFLNPTFNAQRSLTTSQRPHLQILISQSYKTNSQSQISLRFQFQQREQNASQQDTLNQGTKKQQLTKRYLLIVGDNLFSCFIYLSKEGGIFKGKIEQIDIDLDIKKQSLVSVKVLDLQKEFQEKTILEVDSINLIQLKKNQLQHRIELRNY